MPECIVEGQTVFYTASNNPAPGGSLVFIHGSGSSHEAWQRQIESLPPGFNAFAPDLPGHGRSPGPPLPSVRALADFTISFLEAAVPEGPRFLAGHSLGAAVALQVACFDPDLVDGLILVGGGSRLKVLPAILDGLSRGQVDTSFIRSAFASSSDPGLVESQVKSWVQVPAPVLYNDLKACDDFNLTAEIDQIEPAVLVIVGEQDRLTPLKRSRSLYEKLPRSRLEIIAEAGHFAMMEQPAAVNRAIKDFVRSAT